MFKKGPFISQLILVRLIFSYKIAKFGECRPRSNALALSEGECLPKLAIFNSCSCTAASFLASKSAFSCSTFNSYTRNSRASFNSASLKSRASRCAASCAS